MKAWNKGDIIYLTFTDKVSGETAKRKCSYIRGTDKRFLVQASGRLQWIDMKDCSVHDDEPASVLLKKIGVEEPSNVIEDMKKNVTQEQVKQVIKKEAVKETKVSKAKISTDEEIKLSKKERVFLHFEQNISAAEAIENIGCDATYVKDIYKALTIAHSSQFKNMTLENKVKALSKCYGINKKDIISFCGCTIEEYNSIKK